MSWPELRNSYFRHGKTAHRPERDLSRSDMALAKEIARDPDQDESDRAFAVMILKDGNIVHQEPALVAFMIELILTESESAKIRSHAVDALERWVFAAFLPEDIFRWMREIDPSASKGIEFAWVGALCSLEADWAVREAADIFAGCDSQQTRGKLLRLFRNCRNPRAKEILIDVRREATYSDSSTLSALIDAI